GIKPGCLSIPLIQGEYITSLPDINQEAEGNPSVSQCIVDTPHPIRIGIADDHIGRIGSKIVTISIYGLLPICINKILPPDHSIGLSNRRIYRHTTLEGRKWNIGHPAFPFAI